MKRLWLFGLAGFALFGSGPLAEAHAYVVKSPEHHQTFAYGSERHHEWIARGPDRHLALSLEFTNDPYVDRTEPRQYDDCILDFPTVLLGSDGRTFYYHDANGRSIAIADRYRDFLGINEIRLSNQAELILKSPRGYLTAYLVLEAR